MWPHLGSWSHFFRDPKRKEKAAARKKLAKQRKSGKAGADSADDASLAEDRDLVFDRFDQNGDGELSLRELADHYGFQLSPSGARKGGEE